ncbi:MAG TPA: hypothetical protein VLM80_01330 [Anaerolineales bacterium]|nr:hypothetical protein [Anaerolineales bacterium]
MWYLHFQGPQSFHDNFSVDRPLLAWIFRITTSIFGESTLAWQLFGIFTRWLTTLSFWWVLRLIWPRHNTQVAWTALLFAIYPSFHQQYIAVTYSNAFLVYVLFLLSFAAMILAIRKPRWYWVLMLLSIAASGISMFIAEYFFGLELLRPLLLWYLQRDQKTNLKQKIKRIALQWTPYLLLMVSFLVWRVFLHDTPRGEITLFDQLASQPVQAILGLITTIIKDIFKVSMLAWWQTINPELWISAFRTGIIVIVAQISIFLSAAALSFWVISNLQKAQNETTDLTERSSSWGKQAIIAGGFALLVGGWPFWPTNLRIELFFPNDRFTTPLMVGASLLLGGFISLIPRRRFLNVILVSVLVGLAASMHFQGAIGFRQEWGALKDWFWQLSWRAPQIEPGTIILSGDLYLDYYSDNSLTAPLNWTYAPDNYSLDMSYLFMDIEARLGNDLASIEPDLPIHSQYRSAYFDGNTSQSILVFFAPPRCVKVMHPVDDLNLPYKPNYIRPALTLSNLELIITNPGQSASPPTHIFGEEPQHGWCYYFEKAELAVQMRDWEEVVRLSEKAFLLKEKFDRETASELIPFIRGFAQTGQWETASSLSMKAYQASPKMQNMLCSTWYYLMQSTSESQARQSALAQLNANLSCEISE